MQSNSSPTTRSAATTRSRCRWAARTAIPLTLVVGSVLGAPLAAQAAPAPASASTQTQATRVVVKSGETYTVTATTKLRELVVQNGATITSPSGTTVTLTVNGVETGSKLTETGGTETAIRPGTYRGDVVLTVAVATPLSWQSLTFAMRQAVLIDGTGLNSGASVLAAVRGGSVTSKAAKHVSIASTGEAFTGIRVTDGSYSITGSRFSFTGNGRNDFIGDGAAIVASGTDTTLTVDHATIDNRGAVRTGVVATDGSNVIVKNSRIHVEDGVLPSDYQSTVDLAYMQSAPWMLGIVDNVRATNLLGDNTKAAYIASDISSEGWGVLSTDSGTNTELTAINSRIANTGSEGYGTYVIGNANEQLLGNRMQVGSYASILTGGTLVIGDSTKSAVAALNSSRDLGLTKQELASLPVQRTTIDSKRFGFMWHNSGTVDISGGTQVTSKKTLFLDKGQEIDVTVDGSKGAKLTAGNGVLLQVMENDDPGPVVVNGKLVNQGVYTEPTTAPTKDSTFDVTAVHDTDAVSTFTDTTLKGNFYNGIRNGKNLVLNLVGTKLTGVVSASTTKHAVSTITAADYKQLGEVTNTVGDVVNNGVIVNVGAGSTWTVTGESHLSSLTVAKGGVVRGTLTVNGVKTTIVPGTTYTGNLVLK